MNRTKQWTATFVVSALVGGAITEGKLHYSPAALGPRMDAGRTDTLAWNPHTQIEARYEGEPSTVVPAFASGSQYNAESFRLDIIPAGSGFRLIGYPYGLLPDYGKPQSMYGHCQTIDDLLERLRLGIGLPEAQIRAVTLTALAGVMQEIGGSSGSVTRLFSRATLEGIGMTFRPPDC